MRPKSRCGPGQGAGWIAGRGCVNRSGGVNSRWIENRLGAKRQLGLRDLTVGISPSRGSVVISSSLAVSARFRSLRRARRCLLKGCERWFTPAYPQARYCNEECRRAAERWRRVQASRRYRASPTGRERRREQNRQYRQRRRAKTSVPKDEHKTREGKRPACPSENFAERMCVDPAATSCSRFDTIIPANGFVVWPAAWRYVACWIAKRVTNSVVGVGGDSA